MARSHVAQSGIGRRSQTLVIEGGLPTLNEYINAERTNRHKAAKLKKATEVVIQVFIKKSKLKPIQSYPVDMAYFWYCRDRRTDKSNISSIGIKFIEDSLQKAKILRNDGWKEINEMTNSYLVDKKKPRIEVVLIERGGR